MSAPARILITGGAGFIGSHLAAAWTAGGARVTVLDSLRTGKLRNLEGIGVEFVEGSVENPRIVAKAMEGAEIVHHLAALVSVPESMEKPGLTEQINVAGTLNVLEAAKRAGVRKVVFSSTSAIYGMADRPIHRETDLPEPRSPYAISKLAAEHYMELFRISFGVPTVSLRYFNVFGPRQDPDSPYAAAVAIFSRQAAAGAPIRIFDDGEQTRDFVYIADVVAANLLAAERGEGVYNVACNRPITVNELARTIIRLSASRSPIEYAAPRAGDVRHSRGDASRLVSLGWSPGTTALEEGLRKTLASFATA